MALRLIAVAIAVGFSSTINGYKFTRHPENVTAVEGFPASFTCALPEPFNDELIWIKNYKDFNTEFPKFKESHMMDDTDVIYTLTIFNTSFADTGYYFCKVPTNMSKYSQFNHSNGAWFNVARPTFECGTSPKNANVADVVTLKCAFQKPITVPLPVTWKRFPSQVIGEEDYVSPGQTYQVNLTMAVTDNFESFECYHGEDAVCNVTPLQVLPHPRIQQLPPKVRPGGPVSFSCKPTVTYPLITQIVWKINSSNGVIELNSTSDRYIIVNNGTMLSIYNVTGLDVGDSISCIAMNAFGISSESSSITINIHDKRDYRSLFQDLLIPIVIAGSIVTITFVVILILSCGKRMRRPRQNKESINGKTCPDCEHPSRHTRQNDVESDVSIKTVPENNNIETQNYGVKDQQRNGELKYEEINTLSNVSPRFGNTGGGSHLSDISVDSAGYVKRIGAYSRFSDLSVDSAGYIKPTAGSHLSDISVDSAGYMKPPILPTLHELESVNET